MPKRTVRQTATVEHTLYLIKRVVYNAGIINNEYELTKRQNKRSHILGIYPVVSRYPPGRVSAPVHVPERSDPVGRGPAKKCGWHNQGKKLK